MRAASWVWMAIVVSGAFAGCLRDPSPAVFDHLRAAGATVTDGPGTRTFTWEGTVGPGLGIPLLGTGPGADEALFAFQVDGSVGYVEAALESEAGLLVLVQDDQGRTGCGSTSAGIPCSVPVPAATGRAQYTAVVQSQALSSENAFVLEVTLHVPSHMSFGAVRGLSQQLAFNVTYTGSDGGEPTLGVLSDGTMFVQNSVNTMRSRDDGATWDDVSPPWATLTLDPMLYADPWTGRVYANQLYVACSYLYWSDDAGANWFLNPAACGDTAIDHQKVAVGGHPVPGFPLYDGTVYFSFNSFTLLLDGAAHLVVSRSLDGGITWTPSIAMAESFDFPYRTGGPIVADRDGNAYIGAYLLDGGFAVTSSHDHGLTWSAVRAGEAGAGGQGIDPGVAIDASGNVYGAYWGPDGIWVVASPDEGASWFPQTLVSPEGLRSFVLVDAVAGDTGRVAVAYLATADTPNGPNFAHGWARWHLYVSMTEDALAAEPVWITARATPLGDPVQIGSICTGGTGCFGGNRNLLDFIDIQSGPDGRLYVAFTDGCVEEPDNTDPCSEVPQTSRENRGAVAVQVAGPTLWPDGAPWA